MADLVRLSLAVAHFFGRSWTELRSTLNASVRKDVDKPEQKIYTKNIRHHDKILKGVNILNNSAGHKPSVSHHESCMHRSVGACSSSIEVCNRRGGIPEL